MNRTAVVSTLALFGALTLLASTTLAGEPSDAAASRVFSRSYVVHHLDLHEAEVLAWDECPAGTGRRCAVAGPSVSELGTSIVVEADTATHERIARRLLEADAVPRTQAFQVILLVADRGEGGDGQLPAGAAEALAAVRESLPFRRYRPVDTAWLRTSRQARAVLTGPDGLPVEVHLKFRDRVGNQLFIDGLEVDAPAVPAAEAGDGEPPPKARARHRHLLSTSLAMEVGETVLVGTSKLDGGEEALVVLLTAPP